MNFKAIILAAGMGTRMKSKMPKVIHKICGKPVAEWVTDAAADAGADEVFAIVGHKADMVQEALGDKCRFVLQKEQKGTGHAIMQAQEYINDGVYVVLNGDTPLVTSEMIESAVKYHMESGNSCTVITAVLDNAFGYGRIVRDSGGNVLKIVEQKDANDAEKLINEVNSGMYVFSGKSLSYALGKLTPNNAQGEYYLTDTLEILLNNSEKIGAFKVADNDEIRGINDRVQLSEAEKIMQKRINEYHMRNGVTINLPETVMIEADVMIGADTVINQNVTLKRGTKIGEDCVIGEGTVIDDAVIGNNVDILSSVILKSSIGDNTHVGPFAYVRPNCNIGESVRVGDFVELKNSNIDNGTKISHLTYVGDSDVGKRVNFGCGTVTVNYDGKNKFRTTIGDDVFIGCNSNLVAPVKLCDGAFTAAGSTITDEVPNDTLAIARARQVNKTNWQRPKKIDTEKK